MPERIPPKASIESNWDITAIMVFYHQNKMLSQRVTLLKLLFDLSTHSNSTRGVNSRSTSKLNDLILKHRHPTRIDVECVHPYAFLRTLLEFVAVVSNLVEKSRRDCRQLIAPGQSRGVAGFRIRRERGARNLIVFGPPCIKSCTSNVTSSIPWIQFASSFAALESSSRYSWANSYWQTRVIVNSAFSSIPRLINWK